MELRHLRYFCAVAEEGHVTRAAERLRVAQPALTQQIRMLEAELQTPLLRRAGRGIELTEAGTAYWREARAILERVEAATLVARQTARGLAGRLVIGFTESASFAPPVTAVLKQARERWPQVEFSLTQARSNELLTRLLDGRIDVAFMRTPAPEAKALECRPFLTEGLLVALPDTHPLAALPEIDLSLLTGEPFVLPHGRAGAGTLRQRIAAAFAAVGDGPRIVQETPEYVMSINLVAAGIGLTLVPTVLEGMRRDAVVYRPLRSSPPLMTGIIVVSRGGEPSPVVANFLVLADELAPGSAAHG